MPHGVVSVACLQRQCYKSKRKMVASVTQKMVVPLVQRMKQRRRFDGGVLEKLHRSKSKRCKLCLLRFGVCLFVRY